MTDRTSRKQPGMATGRTFRKITIPPLQQVGPPVRPARPVPQDALPARRSQVTTGVRRTAGGEDASAPETGGLYIISVAARLLEMHPQTLRKYERAGLITPFRTIGLLRLYSQVDIARLRLIKHLVDDLGMNLAGVEFALDLLERLRAVRGHLSVLEEGRLLRNAVAHEFEKMLELLDMDVIANESG